MATYATQSITNIGTTVTYTPVTASDLFLPGDRTFLHVKNGGAGSCTVTIVDPNLVDGLAIASRVITVLAATDQMVTIPAADYRAANGLGTVQYSPITSVTAAVVNL